jgi:hypothetical protein
MKLYSKLTWALSALAVLGSSPSAHACAACFGRSDSPMAKGMNAGIFVLMAVIGMVLAGVASFFVFLSRRASVNSTVDASQP